MCTVYNCLHSDLVGTALPTRILFWPLRANVTKKFKIFPNSINSAVAAADF